MHAKPGLRAGFSACKIIVPARWSLTLSRLVIWMRFSIRTCLVVIALVAIAIPIGKHFYFQLNPPTQIRLINYLNSLETDDLLFFNQELQDPDYQLNDRIHLIGGGIQILRDLGHPIQWNSKNQQYEFINNRSKREWLVDKSINEFLELWCRQYIAMIAETHPIRGITKRMNRSRTCGRTDTSMIKAVGD